jgi:aminoglycoside 3-N-acetyltransferase
MSVNSRHIQRAARDLGIAGAPVCVHSSLRSFGHVQGGAATVVRGLLEEGCTVLVPTFSSGFAVQPPLSMRPERNGTAYDVSAMSATGADRVFEPATLEIDRDDMGAIAASVLSMEQHVRGNHPLNSFTAVGPLAAQLIDSQAPLEVYGPLEMLTAARGSIILMGVGLTSMTLLHLAEKRAGRTLFRRWANNPDGQPMMVETGSCSSGFEQFSSILAPIEREAMVGESHWRVYRALRTLELATAAIRSNPRITACERAGCARCADALLGGPIVS